MPPALSLCLIPQSDRIPIYVRHPVLVTSASHMARSAQHFERVGLAPIASPTHVLTGRGRPARLSYWVPSSDALRKTERAV